MFHKRETRVNTEVQFVPYEAPLIQDDYLSIFPAYGRVFLGGRPILCGYVRLIKGYEIVF
jgi:hypothetical protein